MNRCMAEGMTRRYHTTVAPSRWVWASPIEPEAFAWLASSLSKYGSTGIRLQWSPLKRRGTVRRMAPISSTVTAGGTHELLQVYPG